MPGGKILLVDDDEDIRVMVGALLVSEGYAVAEARNGQEALEMLEATPAPDVIVLDLMMPIMSGFEFLEERKQRPRLAPIPVVAMTAYSKGGEVTGVVRVIRKPFEVPELLSGISEALALAH